MTVLYITRTPTAENWAWTKATDYLAKVVYEPEPRAPVKTGLLDASGTPIYRLEDRQSAGFIDWRRT
ncbi:hypothetical protein [Mesorhizobium sp. 128a]